MNRLQACAILAVLWALIYLPGLGSTEIKGEEGRRILPAITMLETGNWLVPYVAGEPFLRKPPLVNWMIAGAFQLTSVRNEWTARLPSALCVLALGLTIVATTGGGWLKVKTGLIAAVFAMTQVGLLAKARFAGAEIEGIYAPLSGMAIVCWLAWRTQRRSVWLVWIVPGILLGIACLAKGPSLHLLFFYAVVIGVVWSTREWRTLWHPAHFAGIALAAAIFASWAVPYFASQETRGVEEVWKRQGVERFTKSEFNAGNYFSNLPRALADQLPWILFLPLGVGVLRRKEAAETSAPDVPEERLRATLRGVAFASALCFCLVLLIPGTLPRYVLPLGVPFAFFLAWALAECAPSERAARWWHAGNRLLAAVLLAGALIAPFAAGANLAATDVRSLWMNFDLRRAIPVALLSTVVIAGCVLVLARRGIGLKTPWLAVTSAALFGGAMLLYAAAGVRWINRADDLRPLAAAIDAAVPDDQRLILYNPGYLAAVFYLQTAYAYAPVIEDVPEDARWLLARAREEQKLRAKLPRFQLLKKIPGPRG
ncbi:MAG TPA: phospholipid carrier-dependent glycosyltransferase, partial [Chthoniobacteraceae bacterium]